MIAAVSCSGEADRNQINSGIDLIRADRFASLVFELDTVGPTALSAFVKGRVRDQVELLVDKPGGITMVSDESLPSLGSDHGWTEDELRKLANETKDLALGEHQARVHVLTVDGHAATDSEALGTLGLSWNGDTIVLFKQKIASSCTVGLLKNATVNQLCEETEVLMWLHEFGHLLGLVDLGTAMQEDHQDPEHHGHDRNPDCVMYWLFHQADAVDKLRSRFNAGNIEPLGFDRQCLDDLAAAHAEAGEESTR